MHDTFTFGDFAENSKVAGTGLKRAIDEFLSEHQEWFKLSELTNNNGLTILERKIGIEALVETDLVRVEMVR